MYLFKVVVRFNQAMPCKTIPYEIWIIGLGDLWSLLIDAVIASNQRVMAESHVRCFQGKRIFLSSINRLPYIQGNDIFTLPVTNAGVARRAKGASVYSGPAAEPIASCYMLAASRLKISSTRRVTLILIDRERKKLSKIVRKDRELRRWEEQASTLALTPARRPYGLYIPVLTGSILSLQTSWRLCVSKACLRSPESANLMLNVKTR